MRRARLTPLAVFVAWSVIAARPARAQWTGSVDAGGAHLKQTGIKESDAATLGASTDWRTDRAALQASFLGARASDDGWTGQGLAVGSIVGPLGRAAAWELLPVAGFFTETNGRPTVSEELIGRIRLGAGATGIAIGAGGGSTSLGSDTHGLLVAAANGWHVAGAEQFTAGVSYVDTRSPLFRQIPSEPVRYADLTTAWTHDAESWSFAASGGLRHGWAGAPSADSWAAASATAWLGEHVGLVLGGGRTLEDVTRGVPRTTYASVALRITTSPHTRLGRARSAGPQLAVTIAPDGARAIVVTARDASTVELMADFTDWRPVALARAEHGTWRMTQAITPGLHRIAIRIDGGAWTAPANLPRASDDLGGDVGLITVP